MVIAEAKVLGNHRITFWKDENIETLLEANTFPEPLIPEPSASFPGTADDREDDPPDASGHIIRSDYDEAFRRVFHIIW